MTNFNTTFKFFKAYDMRGTVPELTSGVYYLSAKALVNKILIPDNLPLTINLCHDCRYSSPEFYRAFYTGLIDAGAKVNAIGVGATEIIYAAAQLNNFASVIITASHNPKDDNGFKIVKQFPQMLGLSAGLDKIRDYVISELKNGFNIEQIKLKTVIEDDNFKKIVIEKWLNVYNKIGKVNLINTTLKEQNRKLKIVVDTANGMGGYLMPFIKDLYPNIEFVPMFWELDGTFPNHEANPTLDENIIMLQAKVRELNANLGVAFDGDADRCYFVDQHGDRLNGEFLVPAFAKYLLNELANDPTSSFDKTIVFPIPYSRATLDTVFENNGVPIVTKQGHTFIKADMKKYNAIYGGEASGHHYFGEFGYMDSGALTLALMVRILVESGNQASETLSYWNARYFVTGEHNFTLPEDINLQIIKEKLKVKYFDGQVSELDGITFYYPDWKFTIRGSNTEPLIRVNVETKGSNKAFEKLNEIKLAIGI